MNFKGEGVYWNVEWRAWAAENWRKKMETKQERQEANGKGVVVLHPRYRHFRKKEILQKKEEIIGDIREAINLGQIKLYHWGGADHIFGKLSAVTRCAIEDEQKRELAVGWSFCSEQDQFCRAKGRARAFGRAIGMLRKNFPHINPFSGWVEVQFKTR